MMRVTTLLCFAFLALFLSIAEAQTRYPGSRVEVEAFYRRALTESGIVGSSFAFVKDGRVLHRQVYGMAHLENKYPVDENTIFHWASITKTMTAVAIIQLRDRGMLKLDDPIVKYVPEIAKVHDAYGDAGEITIRQLLSHSAGFRSPTFPWGGDKDWHPAEPTEWSQVVAMLPYTEVDFKPGSKYGYSNLGYVFLGQVVERLSGDDWEVYIDKNLLKPLEMNRSYFDTTPYFLLKHRSHSYQRNEVGGLKPFRFDMDTGITVSNGGLNSPFPDMVRYINFLIGDRAKNEIYDVVLKRSSLAEMWKPIVDASGENIKNGQDRKDWMGLGFFIEENYGMRFIGHSGGQNGFVTHFYIHPETRSGYIVAYNTILTPTKENPDRSTSAVDRRIKEYLFKNVFASLRNGTEAHAPH